MDLRIVLGIVGIVCVVILISRLTIFLFGEFFGQYTLFLTLFVFLGVGALIIILVRRLIEEQSWQRKK